MTELQERVWRTDDFDFDLPPELIAQQAIEPRDHARLLHATSTTIHDRHVYDLPDILRPGDVLVVNNSRVIPARLYGTRGAMRVEILLLKRSDVLVWQTMARPTKRLRIKEIIHFSDDLNAEVIGKNDDGTLTLRFDGTEDTFFNRLHRVGEPPLPPYIHRQHGEAKQDNARYQTVYAAHDGSVAAPTAGLHFTTDLLDKLKAKGIDIHKVTLHVGAGTFLPVKVSDIREHVMHAEWGQIDAVTAAALTEAKRNGRRIIAVGTTALRLLESAAQTDDIITDFSGDTSIFITPGYRFKAVNALMTNFHLPKSTLMMLVSALMGYDRIRTIYQHAIQQHYRFYSYGDASLLEPNA